MPLMSIGFNNRIFNQVQQAFLDRIRKSFLFSQKQPTTPATQEPKKGLIPMKTALTIAGSDCSGGAGIQADLKTFSAHGVFGMSAIVSVVAENTATVISIHDVPPQIIADQIDAVFTDIPVDAIKVGMLSSPICMQTVAEKLTQYKPKHIIIDPVMYAKNGCPLMNPDAIDTLIQTVLPLATVLTPNIPEAEKITGIPISNLTDMETAARKIHEMGCQGVLVKGGHATGKATDVFYDGNTFAYYDAERIDTKNTHGTGCTYSSAIAANLALGLTMHTAIANSKEYVTTAIRHSLALGKGCGPTHHFYRLYEQGLPEAIRSTAK